MLKHSPSKVSCWLQWKLFNFQRYTHELKKKWSHEFNHRKFEKNHPGAVYMLKRSRSRAKSIKSRMQVCQRVCWWRRQVMQENPCSLDWKGQKTCSQQGRCSVVIKANKMFLLLKSGYWMFLSFKKPLLKVHLITLCLQMEIICIKTYERTSHLPHDKVSIWHWGFGGQIWIPGSSVMILFKTRT